MIKEKDDTKNKVNIVPIYFPCTCFKGIELPTFQKSLG